ncbi:hypothetical protein CAPTEDRAFT_226356 [Capitella teleta]|uniref:DIX domain-containing protein n=1 Tax=Capitella teleta TaxID=283909 RepID=R7V5T4_CAPTE|nr:hypothetical protein CAPTEDRAFT_226356 [Capitella teleta]|eukprot:ELU11676.1 hypothetical protein CAPTEDRAFT_226356 [Capitella teleta]
MASTNDRSTDDCRNLSEQVNAYVAWLNAKLKRKPGCRPVQDLKTDLHDGVALIHLIDVVAEEQLEGVSLCPSSREEKLANLEAVIAFMTRKRIRMHHTTAQGKAPYPLITLPNCASATDIVEGNLKAVMRLILALAAHFSPRSVRQSSSASSTPVKNPEPSMTSIAQNAAVTLADARRDAASTAQTRPRRPRQLKKDIPRSSDTSSDSDHPPPAVYPPVLYPRKEAARESASPRSHRHLDFSGLPQSQSHGDLSGAAECGEEVSQSFVSHIQEEHSDLNADLSVTKHALLQLQSLLLNDCSEEGAASSCPMASDDLESQVVLLRSQLMQAEEAGRQAREDLSRVTQECMQLQASKSNLTRPFLSHALIGGSRPMTTLERRCHEQEEAFLAMKSDLLRAGFCRQGLETTKDDLQAKLEDKDSIVMDLRREMAKKEREIDELKAHFRFYQQEKEGTAHDLRAQIQHLHSRLQRVGDAELALSTRMSSQDRKMSCLEGRLIQGPDAAPGAPGGSAGSPARPPSAHSAYSASSDEMHVVRESLRNLRSNIPLRDDSGQHSAMDALEASISALVEQLSESDSSHHYHHRSPSTSGYGTRKDLPTKVLYFTEHSVTPFMCAVPKRIDEVRLRDIKLLFDKRCQYRYHFKAQDPEFGTVKEEIIADDALVPSFEGKIIAWVEEDRE